MLTLHNLAHAGHAHLQLKKVYLAGVGDSLNLVVVGAFYGKGKRTDVYGVFLLARHDADAEEYQMICKISATRRCKCVTRRSTRSR